MKSDVQKVRDEIFKERLEKYRCVMIEAANQTCKKVDRFNADSYQLFSEPASMQYHAVRALNSRLKKFVKMIPKLNIISEFHITQLAELYMEDVRVKYGDVGADESEVRWMIEFAIEYFFKAYDSLR